LGFIPRSSSVELPRSLGLEGRGSLFRPIDTLLEDDA
jgi:hypothetical protein